MELLTSPKGLKTEATVRTRGKGFVARWLYTLKAIGENFVGSYLFSHKQDTKAVAWSRYKDELVDNSDFRKFDGMLRMVIDGDDQQATALRVYLEKERGSGRLVFGMHKSKQALVTCIIQSYNGNHTHFVDGSDGGYALAARELKAQLKDGAAKAKAAS